MSIIIQNNEKKQARINLYHYRLEEKQNKKSKTTKSKNEKQKYIKRVFFKINL